MEGLAFCIWRGNFHGYDQLRDGRCAIRNGTWLRNAAGRWRRAATLLPGNIRRLQNVIDPSVRGLGYAGPHVAIGRFDGRAHMVGVCPGSHDLVDAPASAAHGKVLGRPYGAAAAITRCSNPAAHIPDVPGHIVGRHNLGRRLGDGIHNGVLDKSRKPIRNTQGIHCEDQFIGACLAEWCSPGNPGLMEGSESED